MNAEDILKKEAFTSLNAAQKEAFVSVMNKVRNKSVIEAMPVVMACAGLFKDISPRRRQDMISAMMECLAPDEQSKLKTMMNMFENR